MLALRLNVGVDLRDAIVGLPHALVDGFDTPIGVLDAPLGILDATLQRLHGMIALAAVRLSGDEFGLGQLDVVGRDLDMPKAGRTPDP